MCLCVRYPRAHGALARTQRCRAAALRTTHICVVYVWAAGPLYGIYGWCTGYYLLVGAMTVPLSCCAPDDDDDALLVLHHAAVLLLFGPASKLPS